MNASITDLKADSSPNLQTAPILAIAAIIILSIISCEWPTYPVEVAFADPVLEMIVRDSLGLSSGGLYTSDLLDLERLDARYEDIIDLRGLEYCINLYELLLDFNRIEDILPLSTLTKLKKLSIRSNQISDISPLSSCINLDTLNLRYNAITDLSPLIDLVKLERLYVGNNPLSDLSLNEYIPQLEARGVFVYY